MSAFEYKEYSVLMSVYHKERPEYLKQAIESIQVQSLSTNDFVLVCDGPLNDELDAVIQTKQLEMGENLNVVRLAKNGGLGNALNEGIQALPKMSWLPGWTAMTSRTRIAVKNRLLCLTHIRK